MGMSGFVSLYKHMYHRKLASSHRHCLHASLGWMYFSYCKIRREWCIQTLLSADRKLCRQQSPERTEKRCFSQRWNLILNQTQASVSNPWHLCVSDIMKKWNLIHLKLTIKQCAWQPAGVRERAAGDWKDIQRELLAEVKSSAYGDLDMRLTRRMS